MFHMGAQGEIAFANRTCSVLDRRLTVTKNPHLLVERDGHVVTITMNRPEARNALDLEMLARLADTWAMIDGDDEIRVAVLTGAGGHFCSGSDLKQMHKPPTDEWAVRFKDDPDLHWKAFLRHYR